MITIITTSNISNSYRFFGVRMFKIYPLSRS